MYTDDFWYEKPVRHGSVLSMNAKTLTTRMAYAHAIHARRAAQGLLSLPVCPPIPRRNPRQAVPDLLLLWGGLVPAAVEGF